MLLKKIFYNIFYNIIYITLYYSSVINCDNTLKNLVNSNFVFEIDVDNVSTTSPKSAIYHPFPEPNRNQLCYTISTSLFVDRELFSREVFLKFELLFYKKILGYKSHYYSYNCKLNTKVIPLGFNYYVMEETRDFNSSFHNQSDTSKQTLNILCENTFLINAEHTYKIYVYTPMDISLRYRFWTLDKRGEIVAQIL